jgi:hypothetical protein
MQIRWLNAFDSYSYRARLLPALLTMLPVFFTTMMLYPALYTGAGAAVASLAIGCGTMWFLASVARTRGRAVEAALVEEWGGLPTTCMLRHRDALLDAHTKRRYHAFLAGQVAGLRLPSAEQEGTDHAAADAAYRSGVKWLLEFTRDATRFPMVLAENTSYGFRRNLYGAKPLGVGLCLASVAVLAFDIVDAHPRTIRDVPGPPLLLGVLLAVALSCWTFFVTKASVLDASRAYARALLAACEAVPPAAGPAAHTGRIVAP